jgi:putative membrane protein
LLGPSGSLLLGVDGRQLDADIDALLSRTGLIFKAFVWQLSGYLLGAFETWWALRLLGHPVPLGGALAIEGLTQAVRHAAFFVPAGVGVQDAAVVLLAQLFGVDREVALSLALVKRMREVLFGCAALVSWQGSEVFRRLGGAGASSPSAVVKGRV